MTNVIAQAAAIPFRFNESGGLEVLLIRRKCGGEWAVPKGHVDPGCTHEEAAAIEAIEEAGVEGEVLANCIGEYSYGKSGCTYSVRVFMMKITRELPRWLEQNERERAWFPVPEAARLARRPALKSMLLELPARLSI
jgi:8-oxo-dGTP pyrophosphatase MutT (NUDIX family)